MVMRRCKPCGCYAFIHDGVRYQITCGACTQRMLLSRAADILGPRRREGVRPKEGVVIPFPVGPAKGQRGPGAV